MSSILGSQGMVLATAMAAVTGTMLLLVFRLQKPLPIDQIPESSHQVLRSCISSEGKKRKKKKKVHFAEDVVEPRGDGKEFRKQHGAIINNNSSCSVPNFKKDASSSSPSRDKSKRMPANRVALYNGILRDRVVQRLAFSC